MNTILKNLSTLAGMTMLLVASIADIRKKMIICGLTCLVVSLHPILAGAADAKGVQLLGPPPGDGPTEIWADFYLSDLTNIEAEKELCVFEGVLTLTCESPPLY